MNATATPSPGEMPTTGKAESRGECPACFYPVEVSKAVFRSDFQCNHCGAPLKVSKVYSRIVSLSSIVIGYSIAWRLGQGSLIVFFWGITWVFLLLCVPLALLILSFSAEIAPYLLKPPLVLRRSFESPFTTLHLSDDDPRTPWQNRPPPE